MRKHLFTFAFALSTVCLLNFTGSLQAQDTNTTEGTLPPGAFAARRAFEASVESLPTFNIQIENGQLSLASFKTMPEKNPWGTNVLSVLATVDNLSKYLRAIDPNLNIVLSPDVGGFTIANLKLNTRAPLSIAQAVSVASGGTIVGPGAGSGGGFGGGFRGAERSLTFIANRPRESKSSVEVFNVSGYIQTLGKVDDKVVSQKLDELENKLIFPTLDDLNILNTGDRVPTFKYHPGTKLLIVISKPEAIEVVRKIINALPGQQANGKADLTLDTTAPSDQK